MHILRDACSRRPGLEDIGFTADGRLCHRVAHRETCGSESSLNSGHIGSIFFHLCGHDGLQLVQLTPIDFLGLGMIQQVTVAALQILCKRRRLLSGIESNLKVFGG